MRATTRRFTQPRRGAVKTTPKINQALVNGSFALQTAVDFKQRSEMCSGPLRGATQMHQMIGDHQGMLRHQRMLAFSSPVHRAACNDVSDRLTWSHLIPLLSRLPEHLLGRHLAEKMSALTSSVAKGDVTGGVDDWPLEEQERSAVIQAQNMFYFELARTTTLLHDALSMGNAPYAHIVSLLTLFRTLGIRSPPVVPLPSIETVEGTSSRAKEIPVSATDEAVPVGRAAASSKERIGCVLHAALCELDRQTAAFLRAVEEGLSSEAQLTSGSGSSGTVSGIATTASGAASRQRESRKTLERECAVFERRMNEVHHSVAFFGVDWAREAGLRISVPQPSPPSAFCGTHTVAEAGGELSCLDTILACLERSTPLLSRSTAPHRSISGAGPDTSAIGA